MSGIVGSEIIAVHESDAINGSLIKTVNARDLHEFLGIGKRFATWIADRIDQYGFTQGVDYTIIPDSGKNQNGRPLMEYSVTLDMAKELSMVERNEKGKLARRYFIQCEKQVNAPQFQIPQTLGEALLLAGKLATEVEKKNAQISAAAPKVAFADRVSNSEGTMSRRNAAKCLNHPPLAFNQWLKDSRFSNRDGMPAQTEITRGHQRVIVSENNGRACSTPHITAKGLLYYATKLYSSEIPDEVLGNIEEFKAGIREY